MQLQNYFAQDKSGNALPGATVYVLLAGTATMATGLKDKNGAAKTNPFLSDSQGLIQFAAANGDYDIRVVKGPHDYKLTSVRFEDSKQFRLDVADATDPAKGAGIVSVNPAISYPVGSVGAEMHAEYERREGKNVMFLGGVLRRVDAGSSWNFIIDSGHRPLNGLSVSVTGAGDIRVNFPTASKIIGFVCGPDETFTEMGIIAGASVGFSTADIRLSADMRGFVTMETQVLGGIPYWWGSNITASPIPGVGVRLDHPVAISGTPVICPASSSFPATVSVGPSVSGDFTNLYPIANLGALVQRTGGGAVTVNSVHNGITTASIGGGVLRISHPTVPAASWPTITPRLNNGALIPVLGSAGAGFLDVSFRDYAGAAITTLPDDFDFTWNRPTPIPMNVVTGSGITAFNLGRGKINANDLFHASGNIWFVGLIEPA